MDRLTSLNVFTQVVETGGFSAASRKLGLSVTMVSNHVLALEERLGARLLNRTTRKVSLTEIGRAYYDRTLQILHDLEQADHMAGALQTKPRGTLRLYCGTHMVRFLAPMISEYTSLYPEVSIDLTIGERMVDLVEEGFDLVIATLPPPTSSLIVRRLTPWRHILCCAPAYRASHQEIKHPSDLTAHNCLRFQYYPFGDDWRFSDPQGNPISVRVKGNLFTNSGETLRVLALDGQGVFLAPTFLVASELTAGTLVRLLPDFATVEFAISLLYLDRRHLAAKLRSFIDLIAARFNEHRKWMLTGPPPPP